MRTSAHRLFLRAGIAALAGSLLTVPAIAQNAPQQDAVVDAFELSAALGWSDNIGGLYQDQVSETIAGVGVQAQMLRENHRLNYSIAADLQYLEYLEGTFDSEVAGYAALDTNAVLVPEILTLVLQDTFGQTQISPFAPSTPDTRQNINVLAAGPDLRLEMGDALVFLASGRYILEDYEITPANSNRTQVQAGFYHEFSADSSLGFLGQRTEVDYDDAPEANSERDELLLRYQLRARRTAMLLEGGTSNLRLDSGFERDIFLYRADVTRELTPRTFLNVAAGYELSDSGSLFVATVQSLESSGGGGSLADLGLGMTQLSGTGIVASTDSLAHRYYRATWRLNAPRTRAYVGGEYRIEDYLTGTSVNRNMIAYTAGIERNLTAAFRLGVDVTQNTRESDDTGITLKDLSIRLSSYWRVSRRTEFQLTFERGQRDSSSTGGGFEDNRVWLRMSWSPRRS